MTTTTERPTDTALADRDLALAKAAAGIDLTTSHKRLVALELARRAHLADTDAPTTGQDVEILRRLVGRPACDVFDEFAVLVAAYGEWARVEDNVDDVRFEFAPPMSRDATFEYYGEKLDDAVNALLGAVAK